MPSTDRAMIANPGGWGKAPATVSQVSYRNILRGFFDPFCKCNKSILPSYVFSNDCRSCNGKNKLNDVWSCLVFLWKRCFWIIGLKAPGIYSDQFWSNNISVFLCEGPKLNISIIFGFLSPGEPLFMDFNLPKIRQRIKENMEASSEHIIFISQFFGNPKFQEMTRSDIKQIEFMFVNLFV